jgi:hypothetical protein
MLYNIHTNELLSECPLNGYLPDGALVQGLNLCDSSVQKACGILPVKSDSPPAPENSSENLSARQVAIEEDGVIITRVWIINPPAIPESVSARQVRLWLINNGINLNQVAAAIETIEDPLLKETTKIEWEYAPYINRNHVLINTLGQSLNLSPEQIDQAFIDAYQL